MKRFRFRLQRLEDLRNRQRRDARLVLAHATTAVETRRREREECERLLSKAEIETEARDGDDVIVIKQLHAWLDQCRHGLDGARQREDRAGDHARAALARYTEASRDHRVLERLHAKRYSRWRRENELEERKFLDETHLARLVGKREEREVGR